MSALALVRRLRPSWLDDAMVRALVVETNDGIIATAGIVEGFSGAGAQEGTVHVAAFTAMLAGGLAIAGAKYSEAAGEREAFRNLIEEERRQLSLSPAEEMAELTALYEARGLSAGLAEQVAIELTGRDPLAAHVDAEHRLSLEDEPPSPLLVGWTSGLAFAVGSLVPLLMVLVTPDAWGIPITIGAVLASLTATSLLLGRVGGTDIGATLRRTLAIGLLAMLITLAAGAAVAPLIDGVP